MYQNAKESHSTIILTSRQLEVLSIWYIIPSAREAATKLNISVQTYNTHLRNIRSIMSVNRTVDAYRLCKELALL